MRLFELRAFDLDSLALTDGPEPEPGPRQVLVRMRAASLNYRDLLVAKGLYNPKLRLPIVPLSDGVGEIVALGGGVTRVRAGQRVCGAFCQQWVDGELTEAKRGSSLGAGNAGVLAEYVLLDEDGVVPAPEHLTDEEAATLPCAALTAWNALFEQGRLRAGETLLTLGTGGVSLFALQFARLAGARVIMTSSNDEKLARARELGAAEVINYCINPEWDRAVRELTGGLGADHVIEVGGAGTLGRSLRAVRMGGTVSLIGVLSGTGEVSPIPILMKNIRVQGIFVGSRAMFEAMNRAVVLHRLRPVVDRVFPWTDAPEALRYLESAAHFGKVCLRF